MATLYITEHEHQGRDANNHPVSAVRLPGIAKQTVTFSTASVQSAAFSGATSIIRVIADANCSVEVGTNPTAAATSLRLAANVPEYFAVPAGLGFKLAVIQ